MRSIEAGQVVAGRYRLLECVGAGSMGVVWRARDLLLRVDVAVKAIWVGGRPGTGDHAGPGGPAALGGADRGRTAAAVREARNAAQLRDNPHVVSVNDVVEDGGLPWIIMELVAATSLDAAVRADGPLTTTRAAQVGLAVLDALIAGARIGLLHRDIKPSNILLADDGRVLLTDFGIATNVADTTAPGPDGSAGTPAYLAPERITRRPASLAADLFSLGATLYFALDGSPPFARETIPLTIGAVLHVDPPPLARADMLWPVIGGLLIKNPDARLGAEAAQALLLRVLRPPVAAAAVPPVAVPPVAGRPSVTAPARAARPDPTGAALPVLPVAVPPVPPPRGIGRFRQRALLAGGSAGLALVLLVTGLLWIARSGPSPAGGGDLLPAGMAGLWTGTVRQGPLEFEVELELRAGGLGQTVGHSDYPTDGCAADLRLLTAEGTTITVQERLVERGVLCKGADRLVLTLRPDGRLAYTFAATAVNSVGNGLLARTSPG
ncbi:hypothetical protein UG55_100663 [Frankia sp. EI5c]|uniref:serine/threonine-protein kinase n=1 Tax=Frankia sp. EI5c TaxID=683316 RepID=UPI0007C246B8|nr:serine/threonine-protein kinase [Frankia sp. EI5c]OAA28091.1 hypothetical protein UG55_100663 [Frankia sp. EI5c]